MPLSSSPAKTIKPAPILFKSLPSQKIHPEFHPKNKKSSFLTPKPTKTRFTPCYFSSKSVIFCYFSEKRGENQKKGKKR